MLTALAKGLSLVPSTLMLAHSSRGSEPSGSCMYKIHINSATQTHPTKMITNQRTGHGGKSPTALEADLSPPGSGTGVGCSAGVQLRALVRPSAKHKTPQPC